jgi:hypothetical protein
MSPTNINYICMYSMYVFDDSTLTYGIEHCGWVVTTPASYMGDFTWKSQPKDWLRSFVVYPSYSSQIMGQHLKLGRNRFRHLSQFIVSVTDKALLNKLILQLLIYRYMHLIWQYVCKTDSRVEICFYNKNNAVLNCRWEIYWLFRLTNYL